MNTKQYITSHVDCVLEIEHHITESVAAIKAEIVVTIMEDLP